MSGSWGQLPALMRSSWRTRLFPHHKNPDEWEILLGVGEHLPEHPMRMKKAEPHHSVAELCQVVLAHHLQWVFKEKNL